MGPITFSPHLVGRSLTLKEGQMVPTIWPFLIRGLLLTGFWEFFLLGVFRGRFFPNFWGHFGFYFLW